MTVAAEAAARPPVVVAGQARRLTPTPTPTPAPAPVLPLIPAAARAVAAEA